jgi:hypothetical protein
VAVHRGAMAQTRIIMLLQTEAVVAVVVQVMAVQVIALFNGWNKKWKTKLLASKMD